MDSQVTLDLSRIAQDLQVRKTQVEGVVQLLDEGNTIPFITRYRKEKTGGLDEEAIRGIAKRVQAQRHLAERKQTILKTIQAQGKLTDELQAAILAADIPKRLEDLYLPYKPKKRSLATAAREKGLEPLAMAIWTKDAAVQNLDSIWETMVNPDKELTSVDDVKTGVMHILAEVLSEIADARMAARRMLWETGKLVAAKHESVPDGQALEYKDYFQFTEPANHIPAHRILALNRGEKENAIKVKLEYDQEGLRQAVLSHLPIADHPHADFLRICAEDALLRLYLPSLEREIRRDLTEEAEDHATQVFAKNLRSLLLQPPIRGRRVLAIDPAFRTGCKVAVLDEIGNVVEHNVIYPHPVLHKHPERKGKPGKKEKEAKQAEPTTAAPNPVPTEAVAAPTLADASATPAAPESVTAESAPVEVMASQPLTEAPPLAETPAVEVQPETPAAEAAAPASAAPAPEPAPDPAVVAAAKRQEAKDKLEELVRKHNITVFAIGNGTACRETEELVAELIGEKLAELAYVIVNEAGASHYSASTVGREEFPDLDATVRGTISIGRRLQDPLSELVKIDPQNVGVGLYQHDLSAKRLKESLDAVIESCVNHVGVDLNTASVPLLRHVAGLNQLSARSIVDFRKQHGPFKNREQLKQVPNVGEATFTQAAGFLKLPGGENPLDVTWVHPESYGVAQRMLEKFELSADAILDGAKRDQLREKLNTTDVDALVKEWDVGLPTFDDIARSLLKPGRDPREDLPQPIFKKGVLKLEDLQPGMELKGTILNVVDFGAFVDVGLKDSGLVHISQLANRYIKSPYDVVSVGDVVTCWVMTVDHDRRRVSLTMIKPGTKQEERRPEPNRRQPREHKPHHPKPRAHTQADTTESAAHKRAQGQPAVIAAQAAPAPQAPTHKESAASGVQIVVKPPQAKKVYTTPPRKPKPPAKLTDQALQGEAPLRTFGELKALYEAKKPE